MPRPTRRLRAANLSILSVLLAASPHPNWTNSLTPKGSPGPELVLAQDGKTDYAILLPAEPTSQEEKAASELSHWLKEMTAAEFRVVREALPLQEGRRFVSVGRTRLLHDAGLPETEVDLGDEGYAIAAKGWNLFLFGGKRRGPLYAVFALLEEDLGCRWYTRDSATVPRRRNLVFRPVLRTFVPVLGIRDPFYWDAFERNWALRNRTNAPRAGVREEWGGSINYARGWFVHTFDRLVHPKEYFDTHPEYFGLNKDKRSHHVPGSRPGQLCLLNAEVLRKSVAEVRSVLRNNPHAELISVSENDGRAGYCTCARCEAVNVAEGSPSGTLVQFVNAIADAIAEEHPTAKIATLAYGSTFMPPDNTRPRDNVVVRLCTDMHAWGNPFLFVTETERFQAALKAWAEMGANISIWDYTTNFGAYLKPWPNLPVVTENIRLYLAHNATGIMLQGAYQSPGGARSAMRSWVWAKQLWDPSRDTRELIRDFTYGYYGASAEPLQQYHDLLWETWKRHHDGPREGKGYPIGRDFADQALGIFLQAERLTSDTETLRRVKLAKLSVLYARLDLGLQEGDDLTKYLAMVDEFRAIAEANRVTHLRERPRGIEQRLLRWRSMAGRERVKLDTPGTVVADDIEFRLATHLGKHSPKIVEDQLAGNGYAVRQPGGNTAWSIQWVIPFERLKPGIKYLVRARVRADKKGNTGKAFHAGVYYPPKRTYPVFRKQFNAPDVSDTEYRWFGIGTILPKKSDFIYIAPDQNLDNVTAVYTDRVELVPVGE